jgi:hypothetical protein
LAVMFYTFEEVFLLLNRCSSAVLAERFFKQGIAMSRRAVSCGVFF